MRGDVVVHQPEPVVTPRVRLLDARIEAPGSTGVGVEQHRVHDGYVAVVLGQEVLGAVGAVVVHDVDRVERAP